MLVGWRKWLLKNSNLKVWTQILSPMKSMAECGGSFRLPISSWCASRVGGEGNRDAMPKRREVSGSIDPLSL